MSRILMESLIEKQEGRIEIKKTSARTSAREMKQEEFNLQES